jgi:hypothetical protein
MRLAFLLVAVGSVISPNCQADDWYEVVPYVCDTKRDEVRIKYFGNWNDKGLALLKQYDGLNNLYRAAGPNDRSGINWRTIRSCKLSGGEVQIISTPVWANATGVGSGPCNEWRGGIKVAIVFAGKEVESLALEEHCHASDLVSAITVRGTDGRVTPTRTPRSDWYPNEDDT